MTTFKVKVSRHDYINADYHWFVFDLQEPHEVEFKSGQFVMLNVPGIAAKKAYSIASVPSNKSQIELLIDISPQGDGTLYLQSLKPGDNVTLMAPAGQFLLSDNPEEEKLIMIATGSGISSVRSMILNLLQFQFDKRQIFLHWGLRFVEDIFWEEEFRMLERSFPNFHFDLVLSKAPEGWPLCTGHINDCLNNHYQNFSKTGFYMCGNPKMVEGVTELLLAKGVSEAVIHHEKF